MSDRPHGNCYWVIPGRLMAGEYPGARDPAEAESRLKRILAAGIDAFVDLTESHELVPYEPMLTALSPQRNPPIVYRRMPVPDLSVPRREVMVGILDVVDELLNVGRNVYVHCWGGRGRTGTVVGCHLVRRGLSGDVALARIAELWCTMEKYYRSPHSPETDEQFEFVRRWVE